MSLFNFTRQEQIAILFLACAVLVGGLVTLVKRHHPAFAPELAVEEQITPSVHDTTLSSEEKVEQIDSDSLSAGKIDINRATIEELTELPGIGPKTAQLIVTYRSEHGSFRTLEDLKAIKGIGDKTIERLRPYAKIE